MSNADAWTDRALTSICSKIGSGITPTGGSQVYRASGRPFVRSQNIGWGTLRLDDLAYISDEVHCSFPATEIYQEDVLLNITGASIGRSAVADERVKGGNVNQHVCIVRVQPNDANPVFVNFLIGSDAGQKQIAAFQAGGNREGLNFKQVGSLTFSMPQQLEQQNTIAQALSDIGDLIASLDALIAKKRDIKQGTMQQLLNSKRRLPGFTGEWNTFKIGQIFDILRNGSHARAIFRDNGGVYCAHYGAIHATTRNHVAPTIFPTLPESFAAGLPFVQTGDLLLADASEDLEGIGKSVEVINCDGHKLVAGLHTILLRPKPKTVAPGYAGYLQFTTDLKNGLVRIANGISVYGVSKNALRDIEIKLPKYDEQARIAEILLTFQSEIAFLEYKRAKLYALRQGMMQQLLTGRIKLA